MLGLKVPKRRADNIRRYLQRKLLLNQKYKIKHTEEEVILPLIQELSPEMLEELELSADNLVKDEFIYQEKKPTSLKDYLKEHMAPEEIDKIRKSFDIIGDVVILEIPTELEVYKYLIAQAALQFTKRKAVYAKKSEIQGIIRTRDLEFLAGKDISETVHKEFGCRILLDVRQVYFSPRLATERSRIAEQVVEGEIIIDMFSGVGPFSLVIARKKMVKIYAIDINPVAIAYLKENIRLNNVDGRITAMEGDASSVLNELNIKADRIIMNLPGKAHEFLPLALENLKSGGMIHYYQFARNFKEPLEIIKKMTINRRIKIVNQRKVRSTSPGEWQIVIDFQVF